MQVLTTHWDVHSTVRAWRRHAERIGFVPTMGNLHAGHLRLVEVAKQHCDKVVVSIYVNPLQFGAGEDYSRYPRTLEEDKAQLEKLKVDVLFVPDDQGMYPHGHQQSTFIEVPGLGTGLEGAHRPSHFRGVATIVNKLFNIVQPDVAVFGEKDFQQLLVIRRMAQDLDMPIEILGEATVREADGLALSSRNQYLSKQERQQAPGLYETLQYVRERLLRNGVDHHDLEQDAIMRLEKKGFIPDYVAIRHGESLQEPKSPTDPLVILAAVRLGSTRLIDNLRV
jgi:pantoate--beta-alanine ligase